MCKVLSDNVPLSTDETHVRSENPTCATLARQPQIRNLEAFLHFPFHFLRRARHIAGFGHQDCPDREAVVASRSVNVDGLLGNVLGGWTEDA